MAFLAALLGTLATMASAAEPQPVTAAPVGTSVRLVDGFEFPNADAAYEYQNRRLLLQVVNSERGTWENAESAIATTRGNLGVAAGAARGSFQTSLSPDYRIVTGEGVVLALFQGEHLFEARRLFDYMGYGSLNARHGHVVTADPAKISAAKSRKTAWTITAVSAGLGAVALAGWEIVDQGRHFSGPGADIAVISVGAVGFVGVAGAVTTQIPRASYFVWEPWTLDEVLTCTHRWNKALRDQLQAQ